jgi:hypothetical protein
MIAARGRALLAGLVVVALLAGLAIAARQSRQERPALLLLSSLPLVFGEDFSLDEGGSPALTALERDFTVWPISTASASELGKARLLLLAHPPAQSPENLVSLDRWVRHGGRVLLLADPLLEWPSERPLGDPLRPPPMFNDTGLLAHWGLRLDTPERAGEAKRLLSGQPITAVSPGALHGAACTLGEAGFIADCRIGRGRAIIVADADWIGPAAGSGQSVNLDALVALLGKLESGDSVVAD